MENIKINWGKLIRFDEVETINLSFLDEKHAIYEIITGKENNGHVSNDSEKLHYIGLAYKQTLRERIPQEDSHPAYKEIDNYIKNHPGYSKFVRIGNVISKYQDKDSENLFKDIEACLIYDNQPPANTINKESYNGRDIRINNEGNVSLLKSTSDSTKF